MVAPLHKNTCKLGKHIIGPHKKISSRTISTLIVIKRIEVEARANQSVPFAYWRLYCDVARTVLLTLFGTNVGAAKRYFFKF